MSIWRTRLQPSCWSRALSTIPGGPVPLSRPAPPVRSNSRAPALSTSASPSAYSSVPPLPPESGGGGGGGGGGTAQQSSGESRSKDAAGPEAVIAEGPGRSSSTQLSFERPADPDKESARPSRAKRTRPLPFAERLMKAPIRAHPARASVFVQPFEQLGIRSESRMSMHKHKKSLLNQVWLDKIRQEKGRRLPDWRVVLQRLARCTPARAGWQALILDADTSKFDSAALTEERGLGIRSLMDRTGCAMRVERVDEKAGTMSIIVYGPRDLLQNAVDTLLETVKTVVVTKAPDAFNEEERLKLARLDAEGALDVEALTEHYGPDRAVKLPPGIRTAQDVPKPQFWTRESLDEYVALITHPRLGVLARSIPEQRRIHLDIVAVLLHEVFLDPEARESISLSSLHRALRYLVAHGPARRRDMQTLFDLVVGALKVPPSTETFNILLSGFARQRDLGGFEAILRVMEAHGRVPNFRTWFTMMHMIESGELRRYMLHIMLEKGLLESPTVARRLARLNAVHDSQLTLEPWAQTSLQEHMTSQDRLYGGRDVWLTRRAGNVTIDVLCRHGRFQDAFVLVEEMRRPDRPRSARPDVTTFTTILRHAKTQRLPRVGLAALRALEQEPGVSANRTTYHLLFELVWAARLPLAVGIVWHYAALTPGAMSYRMRKRVRDVEFALGQPSLGESARGRPPEPTAEQIRRRHSLAALISAIPMSRVLPSPVEGDPTPPDMLLAQQYKGYVPMEPLGGLLALAMERDFEFHRRVAATAAAAANGLHTSAGVNGDAGDAECGADVRYAPAKGETIAPGGNAGWEERSRVVIPLAPLASTFPGRGIKRRSEITLQADYSSLVKRRLGRSATGSVLAPQCRS